MAAEWPRSSLESRDRFPAPILAVILPHIHRVLVDREELLAI